MICPYCHMGEGFFHDPYCRESTPFTKPRLVIVGQEVGRELKVAKTPPYYFWLGAEAVL